MKLKKRKRTAEPAARLYRIVRSRIGDRHDRPGACVHWAVATADVLREWGYRDAQLQAGTASWEIVPPHLDDGVSPNRFEYRWCGVGAGLRFDENGFMHLPEVHCWAAIPSAGVIVDLTLGSQPENCRLTTGLEWTAPRRKWFWGTADDCLALRHAYNPHREAIEFVLNLEL